ncbi:uncharacterized protein LOC131683809 [Topomyia yanbarensis]|uniref:uncharacterized protein LOC131683809 n=1 Tax=Topomyia yanbarensis TaxID=2498891 RepID=UPI00273AE797|nr:uncharacterized protein LOC131683809 [Topomyia yanbarensis]
MSFIAENSFLWQKLAVEMIHSDSVEITLEHLRKGIKIILIRFGLHTEEENQIMLHIANTAIELYCSETTTPCRATIGIACELSGKEPRLKFNRNNGPIKVTLGQKMFLTANRLYEDKNVDMVVYVTNIEENVNQLQAGDRIRIGQIEFKVCKVKGKYVECCVKLIANSDSASSTLLYAYQPLQLNMRTKQWLVSKKDIDECRYAILNNCRFIVIPDIEHHKQFHAIHDVLRMCQIDLDSIHIIAKFPPYISEATVDKTIQSIAGVLTNDNKLIRKCKKYGKAVLFDTNAEENILPRNSILQHVDVFIIRHSDIDDTKDKLRELNHKTLTTRNTTASVYGKPRNIASQCIEYASNHCKANAIILCISNTACEAERLSRRTMPCPILIATYDDNVAHHLLLRKYCFPIMISQEIASKRRLLIKYISIFGRNSGYLKPGNLVITGFGEHIVQGIELRFVPDNFALLLK